MQNSVDLLVSLLFGDDDKKGKKLLFFKCSPDFTLSKDDDPADGWNKGGKAPRRRKTKIGSNGVFRKTTNQAVRTTVKVEQVTQEEQLFRPRS